MHDVRIYDNSKQEECSRPQLKSDTAVHGAGATHKLYKLLLLITAGDISNNIFGGGANT